MYWPVTTNKFNRDLKRIKRRMKNLSKLQMVMQTLADGRTLPLKNKDHALIGDFKDRRECHVEPDWLLIYKIDEEKREIIFERTGTHSDLFKK